MGLRAEPSTTPCKYVYIVLAKSPLGPKGSQVSEEVRQKEVSSVLILHKYHLMTPKPIHGSKLKLNCFHTLLLYVKLCPLCPKSWPPPLVSRTALHRQPEAPPALDWSQRWMEGTPHSAQVCSHNQQSSEN